MELTTPSTQEDEEDIARVGWAIFILSYLTKTRSHAELPICDADGENEDEDHDEHDNLDAETERAAVLQGPEDLVHSKFLDCIPQLLSLPKGRDHVAATALREHDDHVAIDVARNDCFGIASFGSADQQVYTFNDLEAKYCRELTQYLSCQQGRISMLLMSIAI